jgi:lipopolysaccharide/colanic/teichoic acid biosynthesis glycosyltransferase
VLKRLFDIVASFLGLALLLPFFAALAIWIKRETPGLVFYRGARAGRHGKAFRIFKFRTMVQNAEKLGPSSTPDDDSRVTRVGRFLRKYKLDELPQLLNVIKGEMSLVGPRPQVSWAVELYTQEEKAVLSVRPGITDYASLRFRDEGKILRGSANPDKDYFEKIHPEKIRLSLEYIRKQSLWLDCQVLVETLVAVVFRPRGATLAPKRPTGVLVEVFRSSAFNLWLGEQRGVDDQVVQNRDGTRGRKILGKYFRQLR